MAGDSISLGEISAELARRWATQRLAAVQAYSRILSDFGQGRSTGQAAAAAYAKLAAEEAVRYPADAVGIAVDFASALARKAGVKLDLAKVSSDRVSPIQDLEISGVLGGVATGEFLLSNPHDRPVDLGFITSNFSGPSGEVGAGVVVEPPSLSLGAGEDQTIAVMARLDPEAFLPGGRYLANVAISGFDEMVVRVRLTVLP